MAAATRMNCAKMRLKTRKQFQVWMMKRRTKLRLNPPWMKAQFDLIMMNEMKSYRNSGFSFLYCRLVNWFGCFVWLIPAQFQLKKFNWISGIHQQPTINAAIKEINIITVRLHTTFMVNMIYIFRNQIVNELVCCRN